MSDRDKTGAGVGSAARSAGFLAALLLALLPTACGTEPAEPVARLEVTPVAVDLAYPASAAVTASWEMTAPLAVRPGPEEAGSGPWVFVHLLDGEGAIVRTFDHPLPFDWTPGATRIVPIALWQSALAPPLPPGDYALTVGLYDPATGRRWGLETGEEAVGREEYRVAAVRVAPAAGVEVAFDGSWWPAEGGGDRQVLGRRWLQEAGAIELAGLPPSVVLELGVRMPAAESGERLVLLPGADTVRVRVSSPCAAQDAEIVDAGLHEVILRLESPEDGRCAVRLEPSFAVIDLDTLRSRSVAIERLSYTPAL